MERIASERRFRSIRDDGQGVVFNDFARLGASAAQYNVLHSASCRWLASSNLGVAKIWFADLAIAVDWLVRERGAEGPAWKRCATCRAGGASTPTSGSSGRPGFPSQVDTSSGETRGYLITSDASHSRVEAWSAARLPFEPVGTMLQFRANLRVAIEQLSADSSQALQAIYTSPLGGRFDVENVLLYNVGTASFGRSAHSGLIVERKVGPIPDPPSPLDGVAHHHAYSIAESDKPWQAWSVLRRLASFESVELVSLAEAARPASVWLAIRRGTISDLSTPDLASDLGLELTVELPAGTRTNFATLTKPLIDGTVAAFHVHDDPASLDVVAERLHAGLDAPATEIRSLLDRNEAAILGSRRLLWPWRDGVQWNPADDRCAAFRMGCVSRASTSPDDRVVRLRGSMFELAPRAS